jgi:hypothetical protein
MRLHTTIPALYHHLGSVSVARGQLIYPHSASSRKVQEHCPLFEDCKPGLSFERFSFHPVMRLDLTSHDE